jgi:hypothetical protein
MTETILVIGEDNRIAYINPPGRLLGATSPNNLGILAAILPPDRQRPPGGSCFARLRGFTHLLRRAIRLFGFAHASQNRHGYGLRLVRALEGDGCHVALLRGSDRGTTGPFDHPAT